MKFLYIMIWLFPVLFMLHDFEEIIMIKPWKRKYVDYIEEIKEKHKFFKDPFTVSTESLTTGVLIEFLILSLVCIISSIFNNYIAWIGLFIGFVLHLFIHIIISIVFKKYTPGVTTSIILIPICIVLLYKSNIISLFCINDLLIATIISSFFEFGLIFVLHKLFNKFNSYLIKYSTSYIK